MLKVKDRVRYVGLDGFGGPFLNQVGTLVSDHNEYAWVLFDVSIREHREWLCPKSGLLPLILTPEEQDQQRRIEHANKYL